MLKQLTPQQYADLIKKDVSTVLKQIKTAIDKGELLSHVVKIEKFGRFWLLSCTTDQNGNLI